jgi:hypothetical protein
MDEQEKQLSEKESLALITTMINKAKDAYYETGLTAIFWGSLVTFCSIEKFAELQFGYRLPFDIYMLLFLGIIPQVFISRKEKKERKVKSYDDTFKDYVWVAFGIAIVMTMVILNVLSRNWYPVANEYATLAGHSSPFKLYEYTPSIFMMLYGIPTFVTGAALKCKPMFWGGIICWVCCIVALFTKIKIDLLLMAFTAVCAWLYPGLMIERDYRRAKQQLKQVNV